MTLDLRTGHIVGARVRLRPFRADNNDREALRRWMADPEMQYWNAHRPVTWSDDTRYDFWFICRYIIPGPGHIMLGIETDGMLIGYTHLFDIDRANGTAELGIIIGEKDYWGRGYGSDAIQALVDYYFRYSRSRYWYAYTRTENARSVGAFKKAGFTLTDETLEEDGYVFLKLELKHETWAACQPEEAT